MGDKFIDPEKLCMGCMEIFPYAGMPCPKCGFVRKNYRQPAKCMPLYEIVNGRYLIGKVIGMGGFGITYIGWDLYQGRRVCIKEYFPREVAQRDAEIFIPAPYNTYSMSVFTQNTEQVKHTYVKGLKSYVKEAETLSRLYGMPGIVSVWDFFYGNHTAYIVMEYIEGIHLKQLAKAHGGVLEPEFLFYMLKDVMCALNAVHREGMVHRDISPDNIMVNKEYQAKVIDFGAAGSYQGGRDDSIFLKHGYAPVEQYDKNGKQGPWTDIYSFCATIYYLLSGVKLQKAPDRLKNDGIKPLRALGIAISAEREYTIMKGLSVQPGKRYQTMAELYYAIFHKNMPGESAGIFHKIQQNQKEHQRDDWMKGMVLDGRYLLGEIYEKRENRVIWRTYDYILGITCFLFREWDVGGPHRERSLPIDFGAAAGAGYEILGYRNIAGYPVWVFSMKNEDLPAEQCKIWDILSRDTSEAAKEVFLIKNRENMLPKDTILAGRYRVLGAVRMEEMFIAYLCEDINMGRNVMVKEYFPLQWAQREDGCVTITSSKWLKAFRRGKRVFAREIRILAKFIHEKSMITVYDGFSANDTFYIVTEYLPGKSLGRIMLERRYRPFSCSKWKKIMVPILGGLQALHQTGILCGGISPGSILCTDKGEIKLLDLGSAREWKNIENTFTAQYLYLDYTSPEQYRAADTGEVSTHGPWTDIYSLGATMYYCLTGRKPQSVTERLEKGMEEVDFTIGDRLRIGKTERGVIRKCMELDRGKRPQSVEELMDI